MTNPIDPIDFVSFPPCVMDRIMKKMSIKGFSTFVQTSELALELSQRNHGFQYPVEVENIKIMGDEVFLNFEDSYLRPSFELCSWMKFRPVVVYMDDVWFNPETCNLLSRLNITTFYCHFPDCDEKNNIEFFKTAKIQNLKMTTYYVPEEVTSFSYDTSKIDTVEIDNCRMIPSEIALSIKARRSFKCSNLLVTADDLREYIFDYAKALEDGKERLHDMTINYCITRPQHYHEFMIFVSNHCESAENGVYKIDLGNGEKLVFEIGRDAGLLKFYGVKE